MRQTHDYLSKLSLSGSKSNLADFLTQVNMAQIHNNTISYRIANIDDVQVRKLENSLRHEDYINFICQNEWVMFQVPEGVDFTHVMNGTNKPSIF